MDLVCFSLQLHMRCHTTLIKNLLLGKVYSFLVLKKTHKISPKGENQDIYKSS
jgi:hypothetical protein